MFFFLSKTIDIFLSPLVWAAFFSVLGLIFLYKAHSKKRRRQALFFSLCGPVLLFFFSAEPVANYLWRSLELEAPTTINTSPEYTYDVAIILGGLVQDEANEWTSVPSYTDSVERLLAAYDLARTNKAKYILLSGGASYKSDKAVPEARALANQLEQWGIAPERLIVEDRSLNTRDNAVESKKIVLDHNWHRLVMVTSAFHMGRSIECFNAVQLPVDTLSVDYRTYDPALRSGSWLPRTGALNMSAAALRERLGRYIYRVRGYGSEKLLVSFI